MSRTGGWKLEKNCLVPIMSEMNAAPDNLLEMIHCNCSAACKTLHCSCKRYGLPCHAVCGLCQLETCDNPHNQSLEEGNKCEMAVISKETGHTRTYIYIF